MLAGTGGELIFVVKAYRGMTHEISRASLDETLDLFKKGISPFVEDASLGGILLQFPQSFHYTPRNRVYLKALIDGLSACPLFVEFRQKDWLKDTVYDTLRSLGVGFVCVDEPALPALIPRLALHTADTGYVRFHGRNEKNWYGTNATSRYDYCYTEEELRAWVVKLRDMAKATSKVFAFFNNHAKAQAVTNARMLINLLKEPHPS
jgi:uncharacterized protein YecE (DUF72 family)